MLRPAIPVACGVVRSYRLITEHGGDLGQLRSSSRRWPAGAVVTLAAGGEFVVVGMTEALAGDEVDAYLVVRPRDEG
jgi:hypothetical protein